MKIFVHGLSELATIEDLRECFEAYGTVREARLIDIPSMTDKQVALVEMAERSDALQALERLNNTEFMGSILELSQARELRP